uniref:Putative conserved secreted protein n=1 Tax=Panstrongylus lignarius TaxID=156445 RepID=A0A224XQF7_9HEMI
MKQIFVLTVAVLFLVQSGKSEQPKTTVFQDVVQNTREFFDGVGNQLKEKIGLSKNPNGQEIVKVFREHNEKLAQNLKETGKKLEEQLKSNPEVQSIVENVRSLFNAEGEKLKKAYPNVAVSTENLAKSVQATWTSITKEVEKSYQEFNKVGGRREEIDNYFINFFDKIKANAGELEAKVEKLTKKN